MEDENKEEVQEKVRVKKRTKRRIRLVIWIVCSIIFTLLFLILFMFPLFAMSTIGIAGFDFLFSSDSASVSPSDGYISVSDDSNYAWPIGGNETVTEDGVDYAVGDPASTNITATFSGDDSVHQGSHGAIDIGAEFGLNVIAVADGVVTYPYSDSNISIGTCDYYGTYANCNGYGNYVMIDHGNGLVSIYGHMLADTITVRNGDKVRRGQVIGKTGSSGNSTGGHLHFELRQNGTQVDPQTYVSPNRPVLKLGISGEEELIE